MSAAMNDQPQHSRQRSKSTFSFKSDKSHGSHGNKQGQAIEESAEQKHRNHPTTKADPNAAMNEVQPIAAALEKPTLQSLRSFQHTDKDGNAIAEPDLSNPTRSRWERPLDTIRSFEAAIDNEYKRRSQALRHDSADITSGYASRRSSYYGGAGGYDQNRYSQASGAYYGGRQPPGQRDSWAESNHGGMGQQRTRYNPNRMQSDPGWNQNGNGRYSNAHNVYPQPGYHQSTNTVNTHGSGSNSDGPYSGEPSSENSSIDRGGPVREPVQRNDLGEQYGFSGFGAGPQPILEEYGAGPSRDEYYSQPQNYRANIAPPAPAKAAGGPPPPPPHNPNLIKLSSQGAPPANEGRPNVLSRKNTNQSEKRKSWFKRRFSKE